MASHATGGLLGLSGGGGDGVGGRGEATGGGLGGGGGSLGGSCGGDGGAGRIRKISTACISPLSPPRSNIIHCKCYEGTRVCKSIERGHPGCVQHGTGRASGPFNIPGALFQVLRMEYYRPCHRLYNAPVAARRSWRWAFLHRQSRLPQLHLLERATSYRIPVTSEMEVGQFEVV